MKMNIKCQKSRLCIIGRTEGVSVLRYDSCEPTTLEVEEKTYPKSSFVLDNSSNYAEYLNKVGLVDGTAGPINTTYPCSF